MEQVYVPAGEFIMGSTESDEKPIHTVYLDAFWIDKTEVTNAMFASFVSETGYQTDAEKGGTGWTWTGSEWKELSGSDWAHPQGPSSNVDGKNQRPVVLVSWNDATAYCAWAGKRLPTEAEWEKAARGMDGRKYPWGNEVASCDRANYDKGNNNFCVGDTTEVGSYPDGASAYGALDMAGNVWEWVADWYGDYPSETVRNPTGPQTGEYRVLRGGGWIYDDYFIRTAYRLSYNPSYRYYYLGFRCVSATAIVWPTDTPEPTSVPGPTATKIPVIVKGVEGAGDIRVWQKDGMEQVYVPAGDFKMGSTDGESDEKPVQTVYLDAYWMDKYEVSNAQYKQCVDSGGCEAPEAPPPYDHYNQPEYINHPVVWVDWNDAKAYCAWAGKRLPTEAEWEKAARGMDERIFPWGNEAPNCNLANYDTGNYCVKSGDTNKVGSYPAGASPYGVLDMAGNVREWVADLYGGDYYASSPVSNPAGPESGEYRVLRGGGWATYDIGIHAAHRHASSPRLRSDDIGFRCASPSP